MGYNSPITYTSATSGRGWRLDADYLISWISLEFTVSSIETPPSGKHRSVELKLITPEGISTTVIALISDISIQVGKTWEHEHDLASIGSILTRDIQIKCGYCEVKDIRIEFTAKADQPASIPLTIELPTVECDGYPEGSIRCGHELGKTPTDSSWICQKGSWIAHMTNNPLCGYIPPPPPPPPPPSDKAATIPLTIELPVGCSYGGQEGTEWCGSQINEVVTNLFRCTGGQWVLIKEDATECGWPPAVSVAVVPLTIVIEAVPEAVVPLTIEATPEAIVPLTIEATPVAVVPLTIEATPQAIVPLTIESTPTAVVPLTIEASIEPPPPGPDIGGWIEKYWWVIIFAILVVAAAAYLGIRYFQRR